MWTVYSMGDMPIFTSILNAVAMVFNSSMYDPTQGAGVVVVGLLLSIFYMVLPALSQGKIDPKPFIFVLLLFYAGVVPRDRLQVEDIYTGQVTAVDNIPLVILLPASLAASVSKNISDFVETGFSTTSGSYLSMGAEGFVNPLKLMLSLRDPNQTMRSFPYLSQSITEFIKYCASTDSTFSVKTMSSSPDMVGYLTGLNVAGVMTYWDAANPMGFGTSCAEGKTYLLRDTAAANLRTDAENLMKTTTGGEYPRSTNPSTLGASMAGLTQAYNSLTAGILGNMQSSQQFMVNAIAMAPVKQGVDCINQPTGPNMSTCMSEVITREAIEKQNIDAAAQASIFTKTMIPGMNVLLALFYAFSPIVLAFAFMAGSHGIKMVIGLFLFGVWTQSWMPIAAVINFMIQQQTQTAFAAFPASGMTMENYMQFYSLLTMKIGMASTLMAMTPILTFSLLTGSVMAASSLANGLNAKDYTDENKAAPGVGKNSDVVVNGSQLSRQTTMNVGQDSSRITGANTVQGDTAGHQDFDTMDVSDSAQRKAAHDRATANSAKQAQQVEQARASKMGFKNEDMETIGHQGSAGLSNVKGTERNTIHEYVSTLAKEHGFSQEEAKAVEAAMVMKAKTGTPGEALFGSGISIEGSAGIKDSLAQKFSEAVKSSSGDKNSATFKASESASKEWKKVDTHGLTHAQNMAQTDEMAEAYKVATENATTAEDRASESESAARDLKTSKSMKTNEWAGQLVKGGKGAQARVRANDAARAAGMDMKEFESAIADQVKEWHADGVAGSQDQLEIAAALQVLGKQGTEGADQVFAMLKEANLVGGAKDKKMPKVKQEQFDNIMGAGAGAASRATGATDGAHDAAVAAQEANSGKMEILDQAKQAAIKKASDGQLKTEVSSDIEAPASRDADADALADKEGISDEWNIYKRALTNAGLMMVGGAAGKHLGKLIAKIKSPPVQGNPGMLGTDAAQVAAENLAREEAAAAAAAQGSSRGAVFGTGTAFLVNGGEHGGSSGGGDGATTPSPQSSPAATGDSAFDVVANGNLNGGGGWQNGSEFHAGGGVEAAPTLATPEHPAAPSGGGHTPTPDKRQGKERHSFRRTGFGSVDDE